MLGGIEHDYTGVLSFGEVMTPNGLVSMVQWRHPDGRRFSATGDSLMTALAMALQMEKDRLEMEKPSLELHPDGPCPRQKEDEHSNCPKCGQKALLKTADGEACTMCPHLETTP